MKPLEISYGGNTSSAKPNDKAQWNLGKLRSFFESPGFASKRRINYFLLVEDDMNDRQNTIDVYTKAFNNLLVRYNICGGANGLALGYIQGLRGATYDSIKSKIRIPLQNMKKKYPQADFAILLLKTKSISVYSAFKDVVDRYEALQSLCMTQAPNFKGRCNPEITQYMANIMMKVNLKFGGGNHIVRFEKNPKSELKAALQGTLVLGADVTHPGTGSLVGCPSIAAVVGSIDSNAIKFRGSMRLQRTCKKEVMLGLISRISGHQLTKTPRSSTTSKPWSRSESVPTSAQLESSLRRSSITVTASAPANSPRSATKSSRRSEPPAQPPAVPMLKLPSLSP